MAFIEFGKRLYPLKKGENLLGASPQASIRIPDLKPGYHLGISVDTIGSFVWSVGDNGQMAINGRPLSGEPIAVFDGDRVSLNGATVVFINDGGESTVIMDRKVVHPKPVRAAGTAQAAREVGALEEPQVLQADPVEPQPQRQAVGVLRRREDGEHFLIHNGGFSIGREKRCDVIIPDRSISRLSAEITISRGQYLLRDMGRSTTSVNGKKIRGPYRLQVGDVVGIDKYEFDFLRRHASAEELVAAREVTPVRAAVPDAPTMNFTPSKGGRGVFWLIFLAIAAFIAWTVVTGA